MKIVVVSAHQDDEVIGCGGTIIKHVEQGDTVDVAYAAAGKKNVPYKSGTQAVRTIRKQAREACKVLGVSDIHFLCEEDRFISYNQRFLEKLIRLFRRISPDRIYTHHENESDVDHRGVYDTVKEARWLAGAPVFLNCGKPVQPADDLFLFEVWTPMQNPNLFVDITSVVDKKIEALRKYHSPLSVVRYDEAVRGLNRYRGIMNNTGDYAEVFNVRRLCERDVKGK